MSAFERASRSETDCFVQYNFPYQKPDADVDMSMDLSGDVPGLQNHRTATTLCIPETNFNDMARYRIVLPRSLPVQRFLLAAFHGSWSGTGMSAAVTFELWKRYYYPNIRDQLFAKAILPLSKLCGMVTMQKPGETSIQSFSLPLITLPNPAESTKSEPGGHLDINIKYRQSKLAISHLHQVNKNIADVNTQVCLAIEVVRACGLKCAMSELAKKDSSLTYVSDVGGNPYVKIKLPFNIKMNERTTRTIAKTFTPEFSYRMEFILPLILSDNIIGRENQEFSGTLAECLEFGEVVFELWHQRRQESYGEEEIHAVGQGFYQRQLPPTSDVLLGVVKIPLQQLLFSHTGIRGWFPVNSRTLGWLNEESGKNTLNKTVGGLEIVINLSESKAREKIIESGRAVGWCPPLWYELEDGGWLNDIVDNGLMNVGQGLTFLVNIKKVWIPRSVVTAEQTRQGVKGNKQISCYIRYKFYDTKAMFSSICGVKNFKECNKSSCDLKHRHSYLVKTTPPFTWYIREERLEIQVWLTTRHHDDRTTLPRKRDKLLGSAFVALFPLLDGSKDFSQISGLYPLFRSSALDLRGAGLHVQLVLQKPSNSNQHMFEGELDEDIASTEHSESGLQEKDSLTIVSSDEEDIQKEFGKYRNKFEEISSPEDDDVITAHVVIEQALHLPLVKTDKNKSVQPNVYVTYQPKYDVKLIKTKIVPLSTSPVWNHEKLAKFNKATISKQVLTLKVWHSQGDSDRHSTSHEDLLLGLASVDLSPLASGLRQVMGWYNIVDFSGQCQGQVKVGVVPLLSVSPEKALFPHGNEHMSTESKIDLLKERTIDRFSMQSSGIRSDTRNNSVCTLSLTKVPDTSKSLLLRQLRQNLNDLDVIKDQLSQRLVANREMDKRHEEEPGDVQELENSLERLTMSQVNDADLLQSSKTNSLHDVTSAELSTHLDHEGHHVSSDCLTIINTNDSSQETNGEYKELDFHNLFNDVQNYDINIKELNSDANYCSNSFDKGTTNVEPSDCDHGDDDVGESEVNPVDDSNDNDNNYIGDNLTVDSHNKDLGDDENHHTDLLTSDKCFTKDRSFEPTLVVNESVQKISGDIGNQEDSGDESLDSFFDCVTLRQQKSETQCGFKLSSDERSNDVLEPESVVSRTNLSKLRNVLYEKNKDEETTRVYEYNTDKDGLLRADINIDQSSSNQPCGDPEDNGEPRSLNVDTTKTTETDEGQLVEKNFQDEHNKYGTSLRKASIPNFFMPPKDLEQSMRSLRLAATFRKQPKQDNETNREEKMQNVTDEETSRTQGKILTKSFVNWKKAREIRTTGKLPLTSDETSRLSRIFSSNYSTRK